MKTYDIFLFDADGTLFDFDKAEANALKTMFDLYGFDYTENNHRKYREINFGLWEAFEKGEVAKEELQLTRFIQLFAYLGVSTDPVIFNTKYLKELGKGAFLIKGAYEICREIVSCGKLIYIVTNGVLATQQSRIGNSRIKEYITDYFVSEHVGFQKPHPAYFAYVFSHIPQIEKDKILLIGDSLTADIAGGNQAGIDSCWLNPSETGNNTDVKPDYEIATLYELRQFVNPDAYNQH